MSSAGELVRLGIFGGTFDPIHSGHLRSAEEVRERFELREVLFVPSARPPHKEADSVIDPTHRLRMAELATADNDFFGVCTLELERSGPSYSIDTINKLQQERGADTELYFIMGTDAFMEIHTWKDVEELFSAANFLVTSRPGYPVNEVLDTLSKTVTPRWPALKFHMGFDSAVGVETLKAEASDKSVFLVPITHLDISATDIRRRVALGRSIRYLVPEPVERYIHEHDLYLESS